MSDTSLIKTDSQLCPCLKADILGFNNGSKYSDNCKTITFSNIFETFGNTLTGL